MKLSKKDELLKLFAEDRPYKIGLVNSDFIALNYLMELFKTHRKKLNPEVIKMIDNLSINLIKIFSDHQRNEDFVYNSGICDDCINSQNHKFKCYDCKELSNFELIKKPKNYFKKGKLWNY